MDMFEPLTREHKLFRILMNRLETELEHLHLHNRVNIDTVDAAIDFSVTLLDLSHHAKEEQILFPMVRDKNIAPGHREMMAEFVEQHKAARVLVDVLGTLKQSAQAGEPGSLAEVMRRIRDAVGFFRVHVAREETYFFPEIIEYLAVPEQNAIRAAFDEFDRNFLFLKFQNLMDQIAE